MSLSASRAIADGATFSNRVARNQKVFLGLCVCALLLNYLDRASVSIAASGIKADLSLSATQIGGLLSIFSMSYAIASLPAGFLIDRFGVRFLSSAAIFLWSLAQGAGGLVAHYPQLLLTRSILGVTEAPIGPSNVRVVASWFPKDRRGLPTGIYVSGTQIAPAFAPPLLTGLMLWLGWRGMFITIGTAGCMFAIAYWTIYRDVEKADLSPDERECLGLESVEPRVTPRSWLRLFRYRTCWGLILGAFCQNWTSWIFMGWLPLFLETQFHLSVARTGILAMLPFIGGVAGAMCGGLVSDFAERRGVPTVTSRKIPIVVGTLGLAIFTGATGFANSLPVALTLSFFALFFWAAALAGMWTATSVLVSRAHVASVTTIFNSAGFIGATLSPLVTGRVLDLTGSFFITLLVGAGIGLAGAAFIAIMVRAPITEPGS
jgi:MFS transporter, ACS family, L-galactonate transporter